MAEKSGGKYTEQQIEDQMRMMGVTANGTYVSGAPDTLVGDQAPTDSGATWIYAGTTADGKPVLTQGTVPVDPQLQQYISMYGGSASPGQVPTGFKYDAPAGNGSGLNLPQLTGPFTQFNSDDVTFMRNTTAGATSVISNTAGWVGSAAATMAAAPSPLTPVFGQIAFGATVVGTAADVAGQLAQPNVGQYTFQGAVTLGGQVAGDRWPAGSLVINGISSVVNNLPTATDIQNWITKQSNSIFGPPQGVTK